MRAKNSNEFRDAFDIIPERNLVSLAFIVIVILAMALFGVFIKSHDIVLGQVVVTQKKSPIELSTQIDGIVKLLNYKSGQNIESDSYIGIIGSNVDHEKIIYLKRDLESLDFLNEFDEDFYSRYFDSELGSIRVYLFDFLSIYYEYHHKTQNYLRREINHTTNQINLLQRLVENKKNQLSIAKSDLNIRKDILKSDSSLFKEKAIAGRELVNSYTNYLSKQRSYENEIENIILNNQELSNLNFQLEKLKEDLNQTGISLKLELSKRFLELNSKIQNWENIHVLKAPIDGTLQFLNFIEDYDFIKRGVRVLSIIPSDNEIVGHAYLPSQSAGKVRAGQEVRIKLHSLPYNEFGYLKGIVKSISLVSNDMNYLVTIDIPDGLMSNTGDQLQFAKEMHGISEIITKERSLFKRLVDKLVKMKEMSNHGTKLESIEKDNSKD